MSKRQGTEKRRSRGAGAQRRMIALALAILLLAVLAGVGLTRRALAQSGASTTLSTGYDLTWNTVDGGGATYLAAGAYTLGGTAGQPDAALWSSGDYSLAGGFWRSPAPSGPAPHFIYLPLVLRVAQ